MDSWYLNICKKVDSNLFFAPFRMARCISEHERAIHITVMIQQVGKIMIGAAITLTKSAEYRHVSLPLPSKDVLLHDRIGDDRVERGLDPHRERLPVGQRAKHKLNFVSGAARPRDTLPVPLSEGPDAPTILVFLILVLLPLPGADCLVAEAHVKALGTRVLLHARLGCDRLAESTI